MQPWEGLTLEKFVGDSLLWDGPHSGAGEECEESSPSGEGAAEAVCDELTAALIPCWGWEQGREIGSKITPGKKRGEGEVFVRLGFTYYLTVIYL